MTDKLAAALHEASIYGIGATSDFNQRIILEAAKDSGRQRTALKNVRGYIKNCDHEPALDEIDAALGDG